MAELEIIGYLAGILVSFSLSPQLVKTWKTKSTRDISIHWTIVLMSGLFLWIVYGVINKIVPLAIFASIEFIMTSTLFIFKLIYK